MKACTLCGAEYSERISFCFNDGEVLVTAEGGAIGVVNDPFDVPSPGQVAPSAMPPTHTAQTPVPGERRQRSIVQAQDGQMVPPPAQPEPDDFTPRPLQPLEVDPNEGDGPASPMYTPPPGMELDEVPHPVVADPPAQPEGKAPGPASAPESPPPPPRPAPGPAVDPGGSSDARSSAILLLVAGIALAALVLFFVIILVVGAAGTGGSEEAELAEAMPVPEVEVPAPAPEPAVAEEPDDMEIPTPDPLDLGLDAEPEPPAPEPVVAPAPAPVVAGQGTQPTAGTEPASDPVKPAPAEPAPAVAVVARPTPEPAGEDNPWGAIEPAPSPTPVPTAPEPVLRSVAFSSTPSGAELIVDGEFRGTTPITQKLADGDYEITIRYTGHVSQRKSLTVSEGVSSFAVTLPKIELAKLKVAATGRDGDTLFVDGRPIGTLPREIEVKPGSHTFTVEGPGGPRLTVTREITMADTSVQLQ